MPKVRDMSTEEKREYAKEKYKNAKRRRQANGLDWGSNVKPEFERKDKKNRMCLMCMEDFLSAWIGERICPACKATAAYRTESNMTEDTEVYMHTTFAKTGSGN